MSKNENGTWILELGATNYRPYINANFAMLAPKTKVDALESSIAALQERCAALESEIETLKITPQGENE